MQQKIKVYIRSFFRRRRNKNIKMGDNEGEPMGENDINNYLEHFNAKDVASVVKEWETAIKFAYNAMKEKKILC